MSKYLCLVSLLLALATVNSSMFTSKLMSSKTKYEDVSKKNLLLPDGYTPLKAFMLIRHATSSSTQYVNEDMRLLLKGVQDKIKQNAESARIPVEDYVKQLGKNVEEFMLWDSRPIPYNQSTLDKDLPPFGQYEMIGLAYRLKKKIPDIFGKIYDPNNTRILSLYNARSRKSGQTFLETVYPRNRFHWLDIPYTEKGDYTLNEEDLKKKDPQFKNYEIKWNTQEEQFKKSEQFQQVRQRFADKFQFNLKDVDYPIVQAFWETCRWDTLGFGERAVHCSFITEEDHKTLMTYDDMFWFQFLAPHANPFNTKLSCGVIHHLLDFLQCDTSGPKSALYFANRSNVGSIYYALGLVDDSAQFNSSLIIPFMANFVAILFQRDNYPEEGHVVGFYINEELVKVPMPDGKKYEFAPLNLVLQKLSHYMESYCEGCPPYTKPDFSPYY